MDRRSFVNSLLFGVIAGLTPKLLQKRARVPDALLPFDLVSGSCGWKPHPGGIGEINGGVTFDGMPLTDIQVRAIPCLSPEGKFRGPREYVVTINCTLDK